MATTPLAGLVQDYVTAWERRHPQLGLRDSLGRPNTGGRGRRNAQGHFVGGDPDPVESAIANLSQRTVEIGEPVPTATIRKVMRATHRSTELRVADALVTAMERTEAFHDGTLQIQPNPLAPRSARAACCSGSVTSALFGTLI